MRFGLPKVITSDQGGEFNNSLDTELMKTMGIDHRLTTPYHPQVIYVKHAMFKYLQECLYVIYLCQLVSLHKCYVCYSMCIGKWSGGKI